jgi:hypothetical protein
VPVVVAAAQQLGHRQGTARTWPTRVLPQVRNAEDVRADSWAVLRGINYYKLIINHFNDYSNNNYYY